MPSSNQTTYDLIVVGAGITGLSAAYTARKRFPGAKILLLESDQRLGGKILTDRVKTEAGDFIVEGGPDTFLATKPWGVALCTELGLRERLHGTNPKQKNTYVLKKDRLLPLPDGLAMMIPTNIPSILRSGLVSWFSKARMGLDLIMPSAGKKADEDESLGSFVSRRLGREAYENLIEPLMSGIYAGDGDKLSLLSTFPYLRDLENKYGSLARGALAMRPTKPNERQKAPGSRSAFLTPSSGLAEIIEALAAELDVIEIKLDSPVSQVTQTEAGYQLSFKGQTALTRRLILASPAWASSQMLADQPAELGSLAQVIGRVPYTATATVSVAYRESDLPRPLDGYGYVNPRAAGRKALAATWTSTKFPHRAPSGFGLIRVFIGRAGEEAEIEWSETGLLKVALEETREVMGITAQPLFHRVFLWESAMPQYNLGHQQILAESKDLQTRLPGFSLAGAGYRGIGIPDCINSAQQAVEKVFTEKPMEEA